MVLDYQDASPYFGLDEDGALFLRKSLDFESLPASISKQKNSSKIIADDDDNDISREVAFDGVEALNGSHAGVNETSDGMTWDVATAREKLLILNIVATVSFYVFAYPPSRPTPSLFFAKPHSIHKSRIKKPQIARSRFYKQLH